MASTRKKQDDANLETLRELISENGNKYCLDCNQRGPTYVNTTIGSFVCSKCSGMLRGLTPPHRVKSISMATFTPDEIEFIKSRGNDYCRRIWLGLYDGKEINLIDEQSIRDFMSDKYEKKRYFLDGVEGNRDIPNGLNTKNRKSKIKPGLLTAPLISISPPVISKPINENKTNTTRVVNNLFPENNNIKVGQSARNFQPLDIKNSVPEQFPVADFPVDFSTANIYNSSQCYDNLNNNFTSQTMSSGPSLTASVSENDRYAALADLDLALRQENMKNLFVGNNTNNTMNPFENSTSTNLIANKNPFYNGSCSSSAAAVNPFMPSSANNGDIPNMKNPFL